MPTSQDLQYYLKVASRIYLRTSTNTNFQFVFLCQHLNFGIQIPWKAIEMITFQCYKEALSTFIMTAHKSWEEKIQILAGNRLKNYVDISSEISTTF